MRFLNTIGQRKENRAFTMIEVVVATVIFSLAMAGIFASISNLRQPAVESTQEVTAAFIGKRILEDLRGEVNAETWQAGKLAPGIHNNLPPITQGNQTYTATYTVTDDTDGTSARQVTLNISW